MISRLEKVQWSILEGSKSGKLNDVELPFDLDSDDEIRLLSIIFLVFLCHSTDTQPSYDHLSRNSAADIKFRDLSPFHAAEIQQSAVDWLPEGLRRVDRRQ